MDDEMKEFLEEYYRSKGAKAVYCQRCEEPRRPEEFPPFKLGVCIHCLRSMRPGELRELMPDGLPGLGR